MDRAPVLVITRSERKRQRAIARTCGPLGGRDGRLSLPRTGPSTCVLPGPQAAATCVIGPSG
jgi:hypothetical protein